MTAVYEWKPLPALPVTTISATGFPLQSTNGYIANLAAKEAIIQRMREEGWMQAALPCLACGNALRSCTSTEQNHPLDGVACSTPGNYGSTIFDPFGEEALEFNICDRCLSQGARAKRVLFRKPGEEPLSGYWYTKED